jgi:hypothetical protein
MYHGDKPTSSLEQATKVHVIGTIPKLKDTFTSEELKIEHQKLDDAWSLYKSLTKSFVENGFNAPWEANFKALNKMLLDDNISAYKWGDGSLSIYIHSGKAITYIYSSGMMGNIK